MKKFDIITLFPAAIEPYAEASILGRAQKKKLIKIKAHDLRVGNDLLKKMLSDLQSTINLFSSADDTKESIIELRKRLRMKRFRLVIMF